MALNRVYPGKEQTLPLAIVTPMTARTNSLALSGDAVVIGLTIAGVALDNADANGRAVIQTDGIFLLPVQGVNGDGNSAVLSGDQIYFTAADNPPLSKKTTGVPFGKAFGDAGATLIASGVTTASCNVKVG